VGIDAAKAIIAAVAAGIRAAFNMGEIVGRILMGIGRLAVAIAQRDVPAMAQAMQAMAMAVSVDVQDIIDGFKNYSNELDDLAISIGQALIAMGTAAGMSQEQVDGLLDALANMGASAAEGVNLTIDELKKLQGAIASIEARFQTPMEEVRETLGTIQEAYSAGLIDAANAMELTTRVMEDFRDSMDGLSEGTDEAAQKAQVMGVTVINAFSRMAAEVASGSADITRSMIRMITTIAAAAASSYLPGGSVIGAAISAIGGIFGQPFHLRRPVRANQPISMQFTMPPANLLQMARGADTQFLLREGMLVAENQGFRLVRNG
jgi:hypothetical protein